MLNQRTLDTPASAGNQIGRLNKNKRLHGGSLRLIKLPLLPLVAEGKCLKQRMSSKLEFWKSLAAIRKRPEAEPIPDHCHPATAGGQNNFPSAASSASVSDTSAHSFLFDFKPYVL